MRSFLLLALATVVSFRVGSGVAADPAKASDPKPVRKITPGQVIVPTEKMRRIWGELIAIDPKTRTGTFRNEGNDEVMAFRIMPYAELLHHAAFGDVQDYRPGERAIFRLHEDADGKWTWLTYIQDEMNFLNGHKEYYWVDAIDEKTGKITFTQANGDKSFVREKNLTLETDKNTRYWKAGKPVTFADIKVGDKLRTKTHGIGKGKVRVCWEIFLDDESLLKFQEEQKAVHAKRLAELGMPGYVDSVDGKDVKLTLFQESGVAAKGLKAGSKIKLVAAGEDRAARGDAVPGVVKEIKPAGNLQKLTVTLESVPPGIAPPNVARVMRAE